MGQLVKARKLSQFSHQPTGQVRHSGVRYQRDGAPRPALGIINVIFAKPRGDTRTCSGIMFVAIGPDLGGRDRALK